MKTTLPRISNRSAFAALGRLATIVVLAGIMACSCSKSSEMAQLKAAAARNDPEAQFKLGVIYHEGVLVQQDYTAAAAWFRRGAMQGHAVAQYALGEMYLHGDGMLADEVEAAKWIEKSAEQGYAPAQDELAVMYSNGAGVLQDDSAAMKWATRAADQGLAEAQYHLGLFLSSNLLSTVPLDNVTAYVWFSLAAAAGHEPSQESLATLKRQLTPAQLQEVDRRVELWKRNHAEGN